MAANLKELEQRITKLEDVERERKREASRENAIKGLEGYLRQNPELGYAIAAELMHLAGCQVSELDFSKLPK